MQKHKGMDGGLKVMTSYYRYAISSGRTAVQAERIVKEALEELAAGAPSPIMPGASSSRSVLWVASALAFLSELEARSPHALSC